MFSYSMGGFLSKTSHFHPGMKLMCKQKLFDPGMRFRLGYMYSQRKNKHSFKFFLWLPGVVDFKMLKRKLSVKILNEKYKTNKDIKKGLSNKDASKNYGVQPNTISTWIKNKDFFIKIKIKIKYFKDLEDNCSIRKRKLRESDFQKLDNDCFDGFCQNVKTFQQMVT